MNESPTPVSRGGADSPARRRLSLAGLHTASGVLGALAAVLIAVGTLVDLVLRHTVSGGVDGLVEYSSLLIVAVVYLGLSARESDDGHIRITLVLDRMKPRARAVVEAGGDLVTLVVVGLLALHTFHAAALAYQANEQVVGVGTMAAWPARALVPLGFVLLMFAIVERAIVRHSGKAD